MSLYNICYAFIEKYTDACFENHDVLRIEAKYKKVALVLAFMGMFIQEDGKEISQEQIDSMENKLTKSKSLSRRLEHHLSGILRDFKQQLGQQNGNRYKEVLDEIALKIKKITLEIIDGKTPEDFIYNKKINKNRIIASIIKNFKSDLPIQPSPESVAELSTRLSATSVSSLSTTPVNITNTAPGEILSPSAVRGVGSTVAPDEPVIEQKTDRKVFASESTFFSPHGNNRKPPKKRIRFQEAREFDNQLEADTANAAADTASAAADNTSALSL